MTIAEKLSVSELQKGKIARLECELSSESKQIVWQKDHQEIEMGAKYQAVTEGKFQILLIKDFQPADQGTYVCVASGEAKTSIYLELKGTCPCSNFVHHLSDSMNFSFIFII